MMHAYLVIRIRGPGYHSRDGEIIGALDHKCTFCFLIINYNGMLELSPDSRCLYWKFQEVTFFFFFLILTTLENKMCCQVKNKLKKICLGVIKLQKDNIQIPKFFKKY